MASIEDAKRKAILKALQPIRNGWVIGLGSGTTMALAITELSRFAKGRRLEISVVPTSHQVENLAMLHGLRIHTLNETPSIDYAIDGADQVEIPSLNLIKGGGGAMLREKIVDSAAHNVSIIIVENKLTKHLGHHQPVPLEVSPFAYRSVQTQITKMGGRGRLREGTGKVGPVVTDNGNLILDADFGQIEKPTQLERRLKMLPGLLETGLFLNIADSVYVGKKDGSVELLE
ncbi:MAG TPA: ribose 5-phosphate isomerase A [Candidatus Acidoferrales bacterium]|nr:ribose 5-phosphate isomerase A [Candidatus Acidoferrales bacterium]